MYKPVGWTSHDVVGFVRKRLREKRVGHAGTLDPAAEGVLPVAVGQATRVLEFLEGRKSYTADIVLGVTTDTYDREGIVTSVTPVPDDLRLDQIEAALANFRGRISQTPPAYSALKIDGQPLYKAARAAGDADAAARVAALAESKRREVEIYRLALTHWLPPDGLTIEVDCSKGTYIRSLVYDLGQALGVGAYMAHLRRTAAGLFTIDDALRPEDLELALEFEYLDNVMLPIDAALADWPAWIVDAAGELAVRQGKEIGQGGDFSPARSLQQTGQRQRVASSKLDRGTEEEGEISPQRTQSATKEEEDKQGDVEIRRPDGEDGGNGVEDKEGEGQGVGDPARGVAAGWRRVYTADGTLLALLEQAGERWHPAKVFANI